jgi:hypothetical protein
MELTKHMYGSKSQGIGLGELGGIMGISALDARTGCRLLQRYKAAFPVLEDKKKTKLNR